MENGININLTPIQILLSLAFQLWLIIFPIILIRKLNYLTNLLQDQYYSDKESS